MSRNKRILHVDGDSFFASCEIALNRNLEGRPVWVGGGRRGDGIVIAANRIAKKFGVVTGMACFDAQRLCPKGVLCRPHYDEYRRLSQEMFRVLEQYSPVLVPISIDEGFLDLTTMDCHVWRHTTPLDYMKLIGEHIRDATGLPVVTEALGVEHVDRVAQVADVIFDRLPVTLTLGGCALAFALLKAWRARRHAARRVGGLEVEPAEEPHDHARAGGGVRLASRHRVPQRLARVLLRPDGRVAGAGQNLNGEPAQGCVGVRVKDAGQAGPTRLRRYRRASGEIRQHVQRFRAEVLPCCVLREHGEMRRL